MTNKHLTFAEFQELLAGLGFTLSRHPTHWLFQHSSPDTLLIVRLYRPRDIVLPHDLLAARTLLDERGLLNAADFDRLLSKAPA